MALLLVGCVLRTPSALAVEPAECRWTNEPIKIDGVADEQAWAKAQVIENFAMTWKAERSRTPKTTTKARLLWDREYIYFFAEMQDQDLFADITKHNGEIWNNDVFELFFKPADDKPGYFEFEVNAANATLDQFFIKREASGFGKLNDRFPFDLKTAVKLRGTLNKRDDKDEGWSVEGRIRWRDFAPAGGRPNPGEIWKFALCRYDYTKDQKDPELSSTAPLTQARFHKYEDYAPLKFVGPAGPQRVAWQNTKLLTTPEPPPAYTVKHTFEKVKIKQPIHIAVDPTPGSKNLIITQHLGNWAGPGKIIRIENNPQDTKTEMLLDLDYLVYGLTFHPQFEKNGYVYLIANGPLTGGAKKMNRVFRYTMDRKAPYKIDPASQLVVIEWESDGHNGGELGFGPDGMLYIPAGDGTSDSDTNLRGQDLRYLTSAMIRIDVDRPDAGKNYSVPKDNPFLHIKEARPEIWAYGFRNPWRMAFDKKTGQLWVGVNGQDLWEFVCLVQRGENYGWSLYEGSHEFRPNRKAGPTPISKPILEHHHSEARSLTGGIVYYGKKFPELSGAYIYGDFSTGKIWAAKHDGKQIVWHRELTDTQLQITHFCEDQDGELLIADQGQGIWKLMPAPQVDIAIDFPKKLSETGLFVSTKDHKPHPGLILYEVNAPLWSDGAAKERFIALPADKKIDYTSANGWNFPDGAVLVKTFSLSPAELGSSRLNRIETRLIAKQQGDWHGYTYIWNEDQTDAELVESAGLDREYTVNGKKQKWHFPSRAECMVCHSRAANFVLGLSELQFNKDNQLHLLEQLGVLKVDWLTPAKDAIKRDAKRKGKSDAEASAFADDICNLPNQRKPVESTLLNKSPSELPSLADPYDEKADLDKRARSYLHSNCAICHVEAGGGNALIDLAFTTQPNKMSLFDVAPQHHTFGIEGAKIIASGEPSKSILLKRMSMRDPGQMPPLASSVVDEQAVKMLTEWIASLKKPPTTQKASNN
jgi:uncharacterized repeat protein (TIGR03806 family)